MTDAGWSQAWHGMPTDVEVTVHCPRCGARYATTLPVAGVRRIGRCAVCSRTGLEVVDALADRDGADARDGSTAEKGDDATHA